MRMRSPLSTASFLASVERRAKASAKKLLGLIIRARSSFVVIRQSEKISGSVVDREVPRGKNSGVYRYHIIIRNLSLWQDSHAPQSCDFVSKAG